MKDWELWTCPACGSHEWRTVPGGRECPHCGAGFTEISPVTRMVRSQPRWEGLISCSAAVSYSAYDRRPDGSWGQVVGWW